ncbi:MAG: B12-binding domain-containing radical SAM protein [Anaerolineae bacterium]|jgi:anaerobic magnesium-protoporphyrin IX monomethyl ester cyclase
MHISLIYAGITGKGFNSIGQGMDSGWISHGLAILSAVLKREGHQVDLLDLRALRDWDHFREELAARRPDVCGLTMMSVDFNPVMRAVDIIKETLPDCPVVLGGPHPTLATDEVTPNPKVDYIVIREGEIALPQLLRDLEAGKKRERLIVGEHPDLDSLPYADHDLFLDEWRRWGYAIESPEAPFVPELPPPFVTIIAGRGCIYNCAFCKPGESLIFGNRVRRRSVANVIGELKELRDRYQFKSFMFHDDCLTENPRWVREFCQAYREEGFTQPFFCQSRADIIVKHEETVALMAQVGLKGYFIGFESGSDRVLDFIGKGTTRAQNLEAARICRKYGISIWANYMLGLPTETPDEVRETISMLKEIDPDYYSPAFFTPHPGSHLYDYCVENDLMAIRDHDDYARNPTGPKIRGQDKDFLLWALVESQRRTPANALRREARRLWNRYARPDKVVRKVRGLLGGPA